MGPANDLVAPIHDRLAIILPETAYATWIDPQADLKRIEGLLHPYPSDHMRCWRVSTMVNQARNNVPGLTEPI